MKLAPIAALAALIPITAAAEPGPIAPGAGFERSSSETEALSSTAPWWEKLVLTVGEEGEAQSCLYETSLEPGTTKQCNVEDESGAVPASAALPEQMTRITFERRFSPDASLADSEIAAGDTLLGKAVLALAIDKDGRVRGCKMVASDGAKPDYSCKEATAEKFEASATRDSKPLRVASLTILVYAHEESHV